LTTPQRRMESTNADAQQTKGMLETIGTTLQKMSTGSAKGGHGMVLMREERFEILKTEMALLQTRFDKFDDLIFRMRGWLVTIVATLLGGAIGLKRVQLATLATGIPILFYFLESFWRQEWFKYVVRYRHIRDALHNGESLEDFTLYDLTDKYGNRPGRWQRLRSTLWSLERCVFYGSLALGSFLVRGLV